MQRCPYIHEMRERLLGQPANSMAMEAMMQREGLIDGRQSDNQVGTVVKLNADGYGSHTSPTHQRTPLVPRDLGEDFSLDIDDESTVDPRKPKNANTNEFGCFVQRKKRTSLFIITSLVYAMLLIVVCIAYVISDVSTHQLPIMYYEGFFTYLYGASILFLLYVFCFLLQESTCCNGGKPKPPKVKKPKKQKPKKPDPAETKDTKSVGSGGGGGTGKEKSEKVKPSPFQEVFPKKKRDLVREQMLLQKKDTTVETVEPTVTPKTIRNRKTTQNDQAHGSFFLRVGAIAFGLGTMIYVGLEFGTFFEIPFTSQCHQILRGVNPLLQMIFTFMQMYFIFMNSRLNIHRFKVLARFGLMHICATNICVWIRTLVLESLKEITIYHQGRAPNPEDNAILQNIRQHTLRHAGTVMGTHNGPNADWEMINSSQQRERSVDAYQLPSHGGNLLSRIVQSTARAITDVITTTNNGYSDATTLFSTTMRPIPSTQSTTTSTTTTSSTTTTTQRPSTPYNSYFNNDYQYRQQKKLAAMVTTTFQSITDEFTTIPPSSSTPTTTPSSNPISDLFAIFTTPSTTTTTTTTAASLLNIPDHFEPVFLKNSPNNVEALTAHEITMNATTSCGRVNIMGTIVQDSAPYLYPFIIEYSLIGAVVIYVMWKHIGRHPKYTEEDLEHRLEIMLSRRAVAMAQAHSGRVDCVGASKGLFFGLLLLVGSLICLILFFVLVRHPHFSLLAIYLADVSHCALMGFAVFAIFVGFIRVQTLKFRCEDQTNLNDILLRISAFGLFIYSVFSVIAGTLNALQSEPNLLVMITGILAVVQVVLQLLFIADVSRRRVHLPEHDRSKPGRQIVTFLLICNIAMFAIYTFEAQKVFANPVQLDFYGFIPWSLIQRVTLPLCIFHRFHSAVTLAEIWKTTYKARLE